MTTVSLVTPIQIQGQPVSNETTGESHVMPPHMSEDKCNDSNSPATARPSADQDTSCSNVSSSNTTNTKCTGASNDPASCSELNCIPGYPCIPEG